MKTKIIPVDISTIKKNVIDINYNIDIVSRISLPWLLLNPYNLKNYSKDVLNGYYRYDGNFKSIPFELREFLKQSKEDGTLNFTITENLPIRKRPKYSYGYVDIKVKCKHCKEKSKLSEIADYEDDDSYDTDICPKCMHSQCLKHNFKHEYLSDIDIDNILSK